MENLLAFIVENKEWFFSGVAVAFISIVANLITKTLFVTHKIKLNNIEVVIKGKKGENFRFEIEDLDSSDKIETWIKDIKGEDFVDPEPNKKKQSDS